MGDDILPRNIVPKCKNCSHLDVYKIGKHTYYDCYHPNNWTTGIKIYAKNIKTSPVWCPLRKKD